MKLSEAMMLGSATCKMVAGDWNSCALGAAANAIGIPQSKVLFGVGRGHAIRAAWPWLETRQPSELLSISEIVFRFDNEVCEGKMTFEQLVDYVRSIEPECGECNRFECTCKATPECVDALTTCS